MGKIDEVIGVREIIEVRHLTVLQREIPGGRGAWPHQLLANNLFPRDFHKPNIRIDVEKQNKSMYCSNELYTFSENDASL